MYFGIRYNIRLLIKPYNFYYSTSKTVYFVTYVCRPLEEQWQYLFLKTYCTRFLEFS